MYCAKAAKDRLLLSSGATQNVHFLVSTSKPGSKVAKNMNRNEKRFRFFVRRACKTDAWFWYYTKTELSDFLWEFKKAMVFFIECSRCVITLVFLNTCTVAVEHYGQPDWLTHFLSEMNEFILRREILYT